MDDKKDKKTTSVLPKPQDGKFPENEKDLVKQIAIHEAYSAAYKLKLAAVVLAKGTAAAGKVAVKGGKALKAGWDKHQAAKKK